MANRAPSEQISGVPLPSKLTHEPGTWTARLLWWVAPLAIGPLISEALDPTVSSFRTVATLLIWGGWTVGLGVAQVPRTVTLTAWRVLAAAAVPAAVWAAATTGGSVDGWKSALGVAWALLSFVATMSPLLGDDFVNGSAYGPERRMTLRVPGSLLLLTPLTWLLAVVGATAGPLLLGARLWIPGAIALLVGAPLTFGALRALHGLARRWVVFVPGGMVLHDLFAMPDAVLFPRQMIASLGPAPAGVDALDSTAGAPGLALLLELTEPLPIGVREGRKEVGSVDTQRLTFTPTRPGALLQEAQERRLI